MIDSLGDSIERYMDMTSLRQKLVTSNIANADTPGYKTQDFDFQSALQSLSEGATPEPVAVSGLNTKNDGNNVDLDRESRLLAENALRFNIAASLLKGQMSQVKEAIKEGAS